MQTRRHGQQLKIASYCSKFYCTLFIAHCELTSKFVIIMIASSVTHLSL